MAKTEHRITVGLVCSVCKNRNYVTTRNKLNTLEKLLLKKFCKHCKGELLNKRRHYHDDCLLLTKRKRSALFSALHDYKKHILKERICKQCGILFIQIYKNKHRVFCSSLCGKRNMRNSRGSRNARETARKYNVDYEYINPIKVFERDEWICRICRKKTPKNKRGSNAPNAPELDHRIPISKGGGHLYNNVQCLCRRCNGLKSNHNNNGQKPLFEIKSSYRMAGVS